MRNFLIILLVILTGFEGLSQQQDQPGSNAAKAKRFSAGINYSYLSVDMELSAMTLHSVWYGSDIGTEEKTDDQISEINGFVDRYSQINALCLQIGMILLDDPQVNWKVKGSIFGGVAENLTTVTNSLNSLKEYSFNSGFSKPYLGLEFDFGYQFNPAWGVIVRPLITGTMGKSKTIEDNVNPDMLNFNVSKENKYRTLYGKISLLASFSVKKFTVFAGPGLYRIWSHHEYKRVYTQTEDWETITEEMTTDLVPSHCIDGNLAAIWRISDRFSLNALIGIGSDLNINAGLHYNF